MQPIPSCKIVFYATEAEYVELLSLLAFSIDMDYLAFSLLSEEALEADRARFVRAQTNRLKVFHSLIFEPPEKCWLIEVRDLIEKMEAIKLFVGGLRDERDQLGRTEEETS